jgi:acyl carrier protein
VTDYLAGRIREHIADSVGLDASVAHDAARLRDIGWDQLDEAEFAFWLESEFGVRTEPGQYRGIETVGELIAAAEKAMEDADA